jgi:hypothetical protein
MKRLGTCFQIVTALWRDRGTHCWIWHPSFSLTGCLIWWVPLATVIFEAYPPSVPKLYFLLCFSSISQIVQLRYSFVTCLTMVPSVIFLSPSILPAHLCIRLLLVLISPLDHSLLTSADIYGTLFMWQSILDAGGSAMITTGWVLAIKGLQSPTLNCLKLQTHLAKCILDILLDIQKETEYLSY